jgi:hypothetical protein
MLTAEIRSASKFGICGGDAPVSNEMQGDENGTDAPVNRLVAGSNPARGAKLNQ